MSRPSEHDRTSIEISGKFFSKNSWQFSHIIVRYHMCLAHRYDMREWLSWWSTTLPRSGSRVRVPSRALYNLIFADWFDLIIYARVAQLVEHDLAMMLLAESKVAIPMVSEHGGMVSLVCSLFSISSREVLPMRMIRVIDWMPEPGSLAAILPERPTPRWLHRDRQRSWYAAHKDGNCPVRHPVPQNHPV